jgi:uncharacterized protein
MEPGTGEIDLEQLGLRSGQAETIVVELRPPPPVVGGVELRIDGGGVEARVDVSRTSSGFALRLVADTGVSGPCIRCLEPASLAIPIEAREVEQDDSEDDELSSPYVEDGVLDVGSWLHDAITLALPEKLLCRADCAGLCPECGIPLNDLEPGEHRHEVPRDPRFAKLRELEEGP